MDCNTIRIQYARLLGEFQGVVQAVQMWDIPPELKTRMEELQVKLEKYEIDLG